MLGSVDWSDFVPVGALIFTVASFWWIYLRRGRLRASEPQLYAGYFTPSSVRIRFALVLVNTGAAAIAVGNLRVAVDGITHEWVTVRRTLRPGEGDVVDNASPFVVDGRAARQLFAEFRTDDGPWQPDDEEPHLMRIEWLDDGQWRKLLEFTWWPPPPRKRNTYIVHRNAPGAPDDA